MQKSTIDAHPHLEICMTRAHDAWQTAPMLPPDPTRPPLDWDDLRVALTARRAGSFTAAATSLGLRQSTVSRRISSLEAALGGALFGRGPGGLVPTALGLAVCEEAERVEAAVRRAGQRADALVGDLSGAVRIAVAPGLAHYWLVPLLPSLHQRFPGLTFELLVSLEVADLARDAADLALRFTEPADPDLVARRLVSLPQAVVAHPRWLGVDPSAWTWLKLRSPAPDATPLSTRPPLLVSADYLSLVNAAQAGLGVMLASRALVDLGLGLVELPSPHPLPPPIPLWLVARPEVRPLARIDAVWRAIVEHAAGGTTSWGPAALTPR